MLMLLEEFIIENFLSFILLFSKLAKIIANDFTIGP